MNSSPKDAVPFVLKLVVCFLVLDSCERLYDAVDFLLNAEDRYWRVIVYVLWISTNVLLILLIMLRTFAGRLWTLVVFGIHIFYLAFHLINRDKLLWLSLGEWGQSRVFLTMAIDGLIMHLVSRPEAKDYLSE